MYSNLSQFIRELNEANGWGLTESTINHQIWEIERQLDTSGDVEEAIKQLQYRIGYKFGNNEASALRKRLG